MSFIRQSSRIASRVVEGRAVVIVIDEQTLHTLDEVGTFVWSALGSEGKGLGELVSEVVAEFAVEPERAQADIVTFVEQLAQLGAVEVSEP